MKWIKIELGCELPSIGQEIIWRMDNNRVYNGHLDEESGEMFLCIYNDDDSFDRMSISDFSEWLNETEPRKTKLLKYE